MSTITEHPSLIGKKRGARKYSEIALVRKVENEALSYFKRHRDGKDPDPHLEEKFLTVLKKSPSALTADLGILFAVDAGWYKALDDLLSVDISVYTPVKSDELTRHPLHTQSFILLKLPLTSPSENNHFIDTAVLYAVISKNVRAIRILAKYADLNVEDIYGKPLLHYVYSVNDHKAQKQMIDIVLSGLWPSFENLCAAAEHGDIESTKYITKNLHPDNRRFITFAGVRAIQNGHDEIAKWFTEIPEIINWNQIGSYFVDTAVKRNNFDLIEFFAEHSTALPLEAFGYYAASNLWAFLKRVNRLDLFKKFIPPCLQSFEELFGDAK